MLDRTARCSLFWRTMVLIRSCNCCDIWLRASARPASSSESGTIRRKPSSPRANRSAARRISSNGWAQRRQRKKIHSAARPAATTPVQMSRFSNAEIERSSSANDSTPVTTPITLPVTLDRHRHREQPLLVRRTDAGSRYPLGRRVRDGLPGGRASPRRRRARRALSNSTSPSRDRATNRSPAAVVPVVGASATRRAAGVSPPVSAKRSASEQRLGGQMIAQRIRATTPRTRGWQTTARPPRPSDTGKTNEGKSCPNSRRLGIATP